MLVVKTTSPETSPSPAKVQPEKDAPSSSTTSARLRPTSPRLRSCSKLCSYPVVHQFTADHRTHDTPLEPPPDVRAVRGTAHERARQDRPLLGEIHERQVRGGSRRDPASTTASDPAFRGARHHLDEPRERDPPTLHKLRVERREGSLVSQEPGGGLLQRKLFLFGGVRRVVRGHEI